MNRIIIYPYKMSSQSSKKLAQALRGVGHQVLRVYPDRNYRPRPWDTIINWGNSTQPSWDDSYILNTTSAIKVSCNKQSSFLRFYRDLVPTLKCTDNKSVAEQWVSEGNKVFCRTLLTEHSGRGIIVATTPEELVDAPLYTQEFKKTREYRIHVWDENILDFQEKRRRSEAGSRYDVDVWNHGNDFVYARENVELPECVKNAAIQAIHAVGLHFGAVDIGYNHRDNTCAVFEVNSAPGLYGTTLNKYVEKIDGLVFNNPNPREF